MNIIVDYQPHPQELAYASMIFAERKPFLRVSVLLLNLLLGGFFVIFMLKLFLSGLTYPEWGAAGICFAWVFGRRPLMAWVLLRKMKNASIIDKPLHVELSLNGIIWSGKGLKPGSMNWKDIAYLIEIKQGYLLPNSITRFLWLPIRGFSPEGLADFKTLIQEKNIKVRRY